MVRYVHEKTIEDIAPMKPKKGAIASASAACAPVTHAARHATRSATLTFMLFFVLPSEDARATGSQRDRSGDRVRGGAKRVRECHETNARCDEAPQRAGVSRGGELGCSNKGHKERHVVDFPGWSAGQELTWTRGTLNFTATRRHSDGASLAMDEEIVEMLRMEQREQHRLEERVREVIPQIPEALEKGFGRRTFRELFERVAERDKNHERLDRAGLIEYGPERPDANDPKLRCVPSGYVVFNPADGTNISQNTLRPD